MFQVWLATVSLLLGETYLLLFVTYFVTTILFVDKIDIKFKIIIIIIITIIATKKHQLFIWPI